MLRYSFVAIISGLHAVMLLRYITKATVGGLPCQLIVVALISGLLLDSCGCVARCGCLDAILLLGFLLLVCYMWLLRYSVVATY